MLLSSEVSHCCASDVYHLSFQIESFRLEYLPADKSLDYLPLWIHNLSEARVEQLFIYANSLETIPDRENLECEAQSRGIELTFVDVEGKLPILQSPIRDQIN